MLCVIVTAALPIAALGTTSVSLQRTSLTDRLVADLEEVAMLRQQTLQRLASSTAEHARLTAARTQVRAELMARLEDPGTEPAWLEPALPETVAAVAELTSITLTDPDGTPVTATVGAPAGGFASVRDLHAQLPGSVSYEVTDDDPPRLLVMTLIREPSGLAVGAAVLDYDLDLIASDIELHEPGPSGFVTCAFHRTADGELRPVLTAGVAAPAIGTPCGSPATSLDEVQVLDGELLATSVTVPELDWVVTVSASRAELLAPVTELTRLTVMVTGGMTLLALAAATLLGAELTRGLHHLKDQPALDGDAGAGSRAGDETRAGAETPAETDVSAELAQLLVLPLPGARS